LAYTGTPDNQTLLGWLQSISAEEMRTLREYLCDFDTPTARLPQRLIALLLQSPAELCIVPLQDYLELDDRARINTPGTQSGNWHWRVRAQTLNEQLAKDIRAMTQRYGR
jgi:4-alpha-glucanotransferase